MTGNVRREILLYKFLEGFRGINFSGYFISDSVSTLQTVLDQSQNFDRPVDKGDTAVGHAFLKLVDQLFVRTFDLAASLKSSSFIMFPP